MRWIAMCSSLALFWCAACQQNSTASNTPAAPVAVPDAGEAAATVNGRPISHGALEQTIADDVYPLRKSALQDLIEEELIRQAAEKAGRSPEAFVKAEVDGKATPPTADEIKRFFDEHQGQMQGKPFEEMKGDIREYLVKTRTESIREGLLGGLRASAEIKTFLKRPEPKRVAVDEGKQNAARGPKGAPVLLVEWTDYQCPYCSRARPVVNQILSTYGDKVRYVIRDFPLNFHKQSMKAHEAAYCAGDQEKYWEMNERLFANQRALEVANLKEYARALNLDVAKFDQCLESGRHAAKVKQNLDAGIKVGVNGTPAFFVNGIALSGARPFSDFQELIDNELAKTK